jgi:heptosyltransferase-1
VIQKNLALLGALGVDTREVTFPLAAVDSPALTMLRSSVKGRFALINPGAAWPNKRWPADRFGETAAFLHETRGLTPVVLWGPGEEDLARSVVSASRNSAVLAPPTRVPDLVALSREASLVVSGDTGPLHIASAVGTPTVSLFGPTNPERNGPWSRDDIAVSRFDECECHYERRCHSAAWCLGEVGATEVCAAIQRRLSGGDPRG